MLKSTGLLRRWSECTYSTYYEELLLATRDGFASRYSTRVLTSTGRTSRGCRALSLRDGDEMADFDVIPASIAGSLPLAKEAEEGDEGTADEGTEEALDEAPRRSDSLHFVLAITEKGYGKRMEIDEFKVQKRGGKGLTAIKFKAKAGGGRVSRAGGGEVTIRGDADALSCMRICRASDDIVVSTSKGNVVRQRVADLSVQSRTATGFLIQKLAKDDSVVMVDIVPSQSVAALEAEDAVPVRVAELAAV